MKDAGEPGLPGWTINAYADTNGNGTLDAGDTVADGGTTNDASGVYTLTPQARQVHRVRGAAGDWIQSLPGTTRRVRRRRRTLAPAATRSRSPRASTDPDNDFGNYQQATKTGTKFNDLNANGVEDAGEPGLAGWTINAYVDDERQRHA